MGVGHRSEQNLPRSPQVRSEAPITGGAHRHMPKIAPSVRSDTSDEKNFPRQNFKSPRSERREEQYRGAALTRPRSAERHGRLCFGFGTRSSCRICPNITGGRSCFRPEICGQWRPFGLGSRTGWLRTHAHHHRSTSQAPLVGLTTFWGPSSSGGGSSGGQVTIPIAMSRRRHPGDPPAKEVTYRAGYRKLSREA